MNIIAFIKKGKTQEAESQIRPVLDGIQSATIEMKPILGFAILSFPDSVGFEEIKKRLLACSCIERISHEGRTVMLQQTEKRGGQ